MEYVCVSFLLRITSKNLFALALCGHGHVTLFVWDKFGVVWLVYVLFVYMIVSLYAKEYHVMETLPFHNFHMFDLANCCVII